MKRRAPPCWSTADFGGPYGHAKPTQSYPLVIVVPVLAFVVVVILTLVVADLGDDRGPPISRPPANRSVSNASFSALAAWVVSLASTPSARSARRRPSRLRERPA